LIFFDQSRQFVDRPSVLSSNISELFLTILERYDERGFEPIILLPRESRVHVRKLILTWPRSSFCVFLKAEHS
jgi:hypothetical protein